MSGTRTVIGLSTLTMAGVAAAYHSDLAAFYVAIIGGGVVYLLHTLEFKINRLLDRHSITVYDHEISQD